MTDMFEGFDDVEPSYGFTPNPLPTGWYPVLLEKVLDTQTSQKGSLSARLQLLVTEGPHKDQRTFMSLTMTPALLDKENTQKSDVDIQKAKKVIQGMMGGFLKSINVTTGHPAGASAEEKNLSFFNIGSWEGNQFMANVKLRPANGTWEASNMIRSYKNLEDEKDGIAAWREKSGEATQEVAQTI